MIIKKVSLSKEDKSKQNEFVFALSDLEIAVLINYAVNSLVQKGLIQVVEAQLDSLKEQPEPTEEELQNYLNDLDPQFLPKA